ncbi:unnamed protein product [Cuscuta campestris]|uniref:Uncharacterized protein n=1 Tax=Cuscuta campestris TaxID=132261 RepID=A0A484KS84_9ASTE|nr:unnamed protein product [Cuscuta campestris]
MEQFLYFATGEFSEILMMDSSCSCNVMLSVAGEATPPPLISKFMELEPVTTAELTLKLGSLNAAAATHVPQEAATFEFIGFLGRQVEHLLTSATRWMPYE